MRAKGVFIGLFVAFTALSVGCLPKPYGDGEPPNEPGDSDDVVMPTAPGTGTTAGGSASGGGASSGTTGTSGGAGAGTAGSSGGTSGTTTPGPVLEPGQEMIFEKWQGTPTFAAKLGTLTIVTKGAGKAGRVCADAAGIGSVEATIGPVAAGTYTITASVQQDSAAPGNTWTVEATSYSPGPDTRKNQGDLAASVKSVKSTVNVSSGAFAAVFAVRLGTTPGSCMLVDDIRVVKAP